jgi:hypothetical protein
MPEIQKINGPDELRARRPTLVPMSSSSSATKPSPALVIQKGAFAEGSEGWRQNLQKPSRRLQLPSLFFKGEAAHGPRGEFFYFTDNADLMALRCNKWKITFKTVKGIQAQKNPITFPGD